MEELEKDIAENGRSYTSDTQNGFIHRQRPEVAMLNEARRHAQSLLAELGLTPASIGKVSWATARRRPKTRGKALAMAPERFPYVNKANRYARDVVSGKIDACLT